MRFYGKTPVGSQITVGAPIFTQWHVGSHPLTASLLLPGIKAKYQRGLRNGGEKRLKHPSARRLRLVALLTHCGKQLIVGLL